MIKKFYESVISVVLVLSVVLANMAVYAEETVEPKTERLKITDVSPKDAYKNSILTVGAEKSVSFKTYMPFITNQVKIEHDSAFFDRSITLKIAESSANISVAIERNTTESLICFELSEMTGTKNIEIVNNGVISVKINKITVCRDEDKYFYGTISEFVEIGYTEKEAALQTASIFSDNSSLALIRNARRYLSSEDMTQKPVRYNNETYITTEALREALRILVEENSDGTLTVKDRNSSELVFTQTGCVEEKNGKTTTYDVGYLQNGGKKLLPLGFVSSVFGIEFEYTNGVSIVDESHRITNIVNNQALISYAKGIIDVTSAVTGRELHVSQNSPQASDSNSGTEQMPFKTINAAAAVAVAGDKIIVHAGEYRETVTPKNDGLPGAPIIIEGADGEDVKISAADVIEKLIPYKNNTYFAKVPKAKEHRNQLYINGEAYAQGRQPNSPNVDGRIVMSDYVELCPLWPMEGDISNKDNSEKFILRSEKTLSEKKKDYWKYSVFCGLVHEGWKTVSAVVKSSEEGSIDITGVEGEPGSFSFGYLGYSSTYFDTDYGYLTEHISAVDMPGEWTIKGNTLYMIFPDGMTPETTKVEYKARQLLFDLTGRKNILIRNIKGFGGSVNMKDAELCMLDDCDFKYTSHFTWFADSREGYIDRKSDESENGAQARGEVGIYIGGSDNIVRDCNIDISAGAGLYIAGKYSYIYNNNLTECGYAGTMCQGIFVGFEPWKINSSDYSVQPCYGGHSIYYNSVSECGRSPIAINGSYTMLLEQMPTRFAAMDIAYNDFSNGGILSGRDGGLYYAYCVGIGDDIIKTKFHNNLLWDYYAYDGFDVGIYLDAGNTDSEFYGNLCFYTNDRASFVTTVRNVGGQDKMPNTNSFDWDNGKTLYVPNGKTALTSSDYPGGYSFKTGSTLSNIGSIEVREGSEKVYNLKDGELSDGISVSDSAIKPTTQQATVKLSNVDFQNNSDAVKITYKGNMYAAKDKIEMRIDSAGGTKILSKQLKSTAPNTGYLMTELADSAPVSGVHDVYITFPIRSSVEYISISPSKQVQRLDNKQSLLMYCGYFDERGNLYGDDLVGFDDTRINGTTAGKWICFEGRYLSDSFNTVRMTYSTDEKHSGNTASIILDDINNTPIAQMTFNGSSWTVIEEAKSAINGSISAGLHDIYVVFGGGTISNSNVFELEFMTE